MPVLSRTTVLTVWAVSSASADLIRIPFSAPLPVPTIMATGVANPSAQGQDMTSTAIPMDKAKEKVCPSKSQITVAKMAMLITTGTKIPATLSASLEIGALEALASSISAMIWDRVVSSPILLIVAAVTVSPMFFSTGMLSPVMADSSIKEEPSSTTPSTGML